MAQQVSSLAHDLTTLDNARANREYLRKSRGTPLKTQSASLSCNPSLSRFLLKAHALDGRAADPWRPFQETGGPTERREWFNAALVELNDIDQEVVEENLPKILPQTKDRARSIVVALATQSIAPTVYPTEDGEIALYFKSPVAKSSVLILVGNDGQGACFSYVKGKNRRARYDDASELPDVFVRAQLQQLTDG